MCARLLRDFRSLGQASVRVARHWLKVWLFGFLKFAALVKDTLGFKVCDQVRRGLLGRPGQLEHLVLVFNGD